MNICVVCYQCFILTSRNILLWNLTTVFLCMRKTAEMLKKNMNFFLYRPPWMQMWRECEWMNGRNGGISMKSFHSYGTAYFIKSAHQIHCKFRIHCGISHDIVCNWWHIVYWCHLKWYQKKQRVTPEEVAKQHQVGQRSNTRRGKKVGKKPKLRRSPRRFIIHISKSLKSN